MPFTRNDGIVYANAYPDFFPVSAGRVEISNMTASRSLNFAQADKAYADLSGLSVRDIKTWRQANGYTWHEVEDLRTMQLVPSPVNGKYGHIGSVGITVTRAITPLLRDYSDTCNNPFTPGPSEIA